jgi:hypothetical protein
MMNKIKLAVLTFAVLIGVATFVPSHTVSADAKSQITEGFKTAGGDPATDNFNLKISSVVSVLMYILGVLSVIMIIVGGIRYTASNGDAGRIKAAKDTITYAVVGLVVAILAYAIVNFVIKNV